MLRRNLQDPLWVYRMIQTNALPDKFTQELHKQTSAHLSGKLSGKTIIFYHRLGQVLMSTTGCTNPN